MTVDEALSAPAPRGFTSAPDRCANGIEGASCYAAEDARRSTGDIAEAWAEHYELAGLPIVEGPVCEGPTGAPACFVKARAADGVVVAVASSDALGQHATVLVARMQDG